MRVRLPGLIVVLLILWCFTPAAVCYGQGNSPPTANAGSDQSVTDSDGDTRATVTLDGSQSSDSDGTIAAYAWSRGGSAIASGATPQVSFDIGTHTVTLTVTDNLGATGSDTVVVTVNPPASMATLSYAYGSTNTTYHFRPLTITAVKDSVNIWQMKVWVPEAGYQQSHDVACAGEIAEFKDLQFGGTAFNYSPEGSTYSWSSGLLRMSGFQGNYSDASGQTGSYFEFTKTHTITSGITSHLRVRVRAPLVSGSHYTSDIDATYTMTNQSGATYNLWGTNDTAGAGSLNLAHGGYTNWSFVNPNNATSKPNLHNTDTTNGHQLYTITDWYGTTVAQTPTGFFGQMVVKDNAATAALNMRPGMSFELRCDDIDFYYSDLSNYMYGWAAVSSSAGVRCLLDRAPGTFGSGATLANGQSRSRDWAAEIVAPGNYEPVANAGTDQVVNDTDRNGSEGVTLDGSASSDSDGTIAGYAWTENSTQIATGAQPTVTLAAGSHTITLTVTDNDGATAADDVTVLVNVPPVADAGSAQEVRDSDNGGTETVTLVATGSSDSDGTIATYVWTEGGQQIATGATAEVALSVGVHTITLTVTDNNGATATATVEVTVLLGPQPGTLSYAYGSTNTTYHYRPLQITASYDSDQVWRMDLWVPQDGYSDTSHSYWLSGEIASFKDSYFGGTAFEYSPEAGNVTSRGLLRMSNTAGTFADSGGQQSGYYEFTKTATLTTGVTAELRVRISAPVILDSDYETIITGTYTITNSSGSAFSLWGTSTSAGMGSLNLAHGGLSNWSFVNPNSAAGKPNSHLTDSTDGHQLYKVYDWYGSTVTSAFPGYFAKLEVRNTSDATSRNMRPGLTFELRCDNLSYYYTDTANNMYGSTGVSSAYGVACLLTGQPDCFGSGASLPSGQSIALNWEGVISTTPRGIPPIAVAGADQEVDDADWGGTESVTLNGSASFDADGSIASYVWREESTQIATGAQPQVTLAVGSHTITLTVTDNDGVTAADTLVVNVTSTQPQTYYVDQGHQSASNSNPGTEALPWLTIGKAAASVRRGDTVIIKEGLYREVVNVGASGTDGYPITFQAATGDRVVVSGSEALTGWTQLPSSYASRNASYANIYYRDQNWKPFRLYEDGSERPRARSPNSGWWIVRAGSDMYHVVDQYHLTQASSDYWVGCTMFFMNLQPSVESTPTITAYDPSTNKVTLSTRVCATEDCGDPVNGPQADIDHYYMCNKLELMDIPGEYVCEDLGGGNYRIYIWPLDSGTPDGHLFEGSKVAGGLFNWGAQDYLVIDGLEIRHCGSGTALGSTSGGSTDIEVKNCVAHSNGYMAINVVGGTRISIHNNVMTRNGYGVSVTSGTTDVEIFENEIYANEVDGFLASYDTSDVYFERNYLHDHLLWGHPDNMQFHSVVSNLWVQDNVIVASGQTAMIERTDGLHFINNMIVGSVAVMLHGGASNQELDGNTLFCSGYLMAALGATGYDFTNNIFYKGHGAVLYAATSTQSYQSDYNVFFHAPGLNESVISWNSSWLSFANYVTASGQDANSYYANPLFVNAPQHYARMDYYLTPHFTTSRVYVESLYSFEVDDHVELNFDGVVRTVTARGTDGLGDYLDFSPSLAEVLPTAGVVANWKTGTDFELDLAVQAGSPALDNGEGGRDIGCSLSIPQYRSGDFNGDSVRDVPVWPPQ